MTAESRCLAEFVTATPWEALPARTVDATKIAIVDWFGSALAGSCEPAAVMARKLAAGFGRSDEASVFPEGRSSAMGAAFANGVASHILELDDIHKGSTIHGGAPIIPAALAVAERDHASGPAFLRAVALGYEAALRTGEAVNPSHYRFWHPTGTAATFGSAVAAGLLIGLDAEQMLHALGSAGTQAAGLWEFNADGAMSKHLHPGKAAMNGVMSADLAKLGFTGASRILEGERGFFAAMSTGADPSRITAGLGERWKVEENGYKLHSCCGHTHTAIDSALALRSELGLDGDAAGRIARIEIALYGPGYAIVREPNPRTPYAAQFSLAYCVAAALSEGRVGLEQFSPERFGPEGVTEPRIGALLARTEAAVDPALSERYPARWPSRLTIELADGRRITREADYPAGHPENPVSKAILEAKAAGLIASRFDAGLAARAIGFVNGLEAVDDVAVAIPTML